MLARVEPFETALQLRLEHGLCVGVRIPSGPIPVSDAALTGLDPREKAWAVQMPPARRATWIAGRVALRRALGALGISAHPLLASADGAPRLPAAASGSISHKGALAIALAGPRPAGHLGVDLELDRAADLRLARRVLTPDEREALSRLDVQAAGRDLLLRFALKEALYKALHPWLRRKIGFQEVEAAPEDGGRAHVRLALADAPAGLGADARWHRHEGWIVATARTTGGSSPRLRLS